MKNDKNDMVNSFEFGLGHFVNLLLNGKEEEEIDYQIGDKVMSNIDHSEIGICTGFCDDTMNVEVNGIWRGDKTYFQKSEWTEFEVIE